MRNSGQNSLLKSEALGKDSKLIPNKLLFAFLFDIKSMVPDADHIPTWWIKLQLIEFFFISYKQAVETFDYMLSTGMILYSEGGEND